MKYDIHHFRLRMLTKLSCAIVNTSMFARFFRRNFTTSIQLFHSCVWARTVRESAHVKDVFGLETLTLLYELVIAWKFYRLYLNKANKSPASK